MLLIKGWGFASNIASRLIFLLAPLYNKLATIKMRVLQLFECCLGFLSRSELDEAETTMTLAVDFLGQAHFLEGAVLFE